MRNRRSLQLALTTIAGGLLALTGCGPSVSNGPSQVCDEAGMCVTIDSGLGGNYEMLPPDSLPAPHVLVSIEVDPVNPVLFINNGMPAMQAFTVKGIYADRTTGDVTSMATWTVAKPSLGTMSGALYTSTTLGGFTNITASVPGPSGTPLTNYTTLTQVPRRVDPSGMPLDFFFIAPYMASTTPASAVLQFGTNIQSADVAFVVDTTGSMGDKIANLQSSLSSLASTIAGKIPSVAMGVGDFKSWPCSPDGSSGDYPWKMDQRIVTVKSAGLTAVQNAIAGLSATGGFDGPEDDFDAAWFAATGSSNPDCAGGTVPAFNPSSPGASGETTGTIGGMGFRTGALPIVVLVSDAESHDAQDSADSCSFGFGSFYGASYAHGHTATLDALTKVNARIIGIASSGGGESFQPSISPLPPGWTAAAGPEPYGQYYWLAEKTGTVVPVAAYGGACGAGQCCTGVSGAASPPDASGNCPLVYEVDSTGSGLGTSLADAISKLVTFGVMNVGTQVTGKTTDESMPPNPLPAGHTTADFLLPIGPLKGVTPLDSTPAVGSTGTPPGPTAIDTSKGEFLNVQPGTQVRFTVKAYNDFIMPLAGTPQFFQATIEVVGNGSTYLDSRAVYILVPPSVPLG